MKARSLPPVAFVHGNAGAFPFLFDAVDVVLATYGKRGGVPTGWQMAPARSTHADVGGVMEGVDHCFLWNHGKAREANLDVTVPRAMPRDVHSVISDVVCGQPCPRPNAVRLDTPRVLEVAPGLYHGGGLLPVDHPGGLFVVHRVFIKSKWCQRRLTKKEVATAFNVPHQVVEAWSDAELSLLPNQPSRALEHCAKSRLSAGRVYLCGRRDEHEAAG
jgi:hypothetical protein